MLNKKIQLTIMVIFKYVKFKRQEIHRDIFKAEIRKVMSSSDTCENKNMTHNQSDNHSL